MINQAFARFYFGDQDPPVKRLGAGGGKAECTIGGVTQNTKYREMRKAPTDSGMCLTRNLASRAVSGR